MVLNVLARIACEKWRRRTLETTVATLLLITAAVVLASTVVTIAVTIFEKTLNTNDVPQLNQLRDLQNNLLNQTSVFNGTEPQLPINSPAPAP
jgi:hypothetical protein